MGRSVKEVVLEQPGGNVVLGADRFQSDAAEVIAEGGAFFALLTTGFVAAMMTDRSVPGAIAGSREAEVTFRSSPVPGHIEMLGHGDEVDWVDEWTRLFGDMERLIGGQIAEIQLLDEEYPLGTESFSALVEGIMRVWRRVPDNKKPGLADARRSPEFLLVSAR